MDYKDSAPMMIIGIIAWTIGREPVGSFQWWSEHLQRSVACRDKRACGEGIGGDHAMNELVRNLRAAVERDVHKNDDRAAIRDCETAILAGSCRAANGLKDG